MQGLVGEDLAVHIEGRVLFDGVAMRAPRGARVGVVGPSGSGKSTLLRVLCTLRDPDRGTLTFDGEPPGALGHPRWRRRVCYVPQEPVMWPGTVADNLAMPHRYRVAAGGFAEPPARALMAELGLAASQWDADAERLSVGERQRVALARVLLLEPQVLLLDEPTSALDDASKASVERWLGRFVERGGAFVLVSHDPAQLERLTDARVALGAT